MINGPLLAFAAFAVALLILGIAIGVGKWLAYRRGA